MTSIWKMSVAIVPLYLLAGCGSNEEPSAGEAQAAPSELNENMVQRLVAEYPVLQAEPAPQPEPSSDADGIPEGVLEAAEGEATFYADSFEGRRTASGIPFRQNQFVAAHRGFPFGTLLRVTNLRNDRTVNVRVVDRGPHGSRAEARGTIIDLSRRAAETLDYVSDGRTPVRVEVLEWGDGIPRTS
jgi:rare lipoprotein A